MSLCEKIKIRATPHIGYVQIPTCATGWHDDPRGHPPFGASARGSHTNAHRSGPLLPGVCNTHAAFATAPLYGSSGHGDATEHEGEQKSPSMPRICTRASLGRHGPFDGSPYGFVRSCGCGGVGPGAPTFPIASIVARAMRRTSATA